MRELLFLCHRIPYPPDKGDKIRAFHLLEHLACSFHVHLGCLADNPKDLVHVPALRARTASLGCFPLDRRAARARSMTGFATGRPLSLDYFRDRRVARWVAETLARRSIAQLFVFSAAMAPYVMQIPTLPRILDMVDIDSEKFAAYARGAAFPMRYLWAREARRLFAFEREAAIHFDRTLFVSPAEEARFLELAPECRGRTGWVENGVDLDFFSPDCEFPSPFAPSERSIVFTGTMDYKPNVDAVTWFADAVLPLLTGEPRPVFFIVGGEPVPAVRALARRAEVRVTGRVPDTRPFLAHASLVVAPLRIGRGIQNKVLEAMALARPVLASPAAVEGIRATAGQDVLVATESGEMARLAGEVLAGRHPGLGAAARRAVLRSHDWRTTLARLDPMLAAPHADAPEVLGAGA